MDFNKFKEEISPISIPEGLLEKKFITSPDSAHVIIAVRYVPGEQMMTIIDDGTANFFLKMLKLVKARGAKQSNDYIVTLLDDGPSKQVRIGLHTLKTFISREDFDKNEIK